MSNLKGVISAKSKHLSGEAVSREVIIGKEIADEVIEARGDKDTLKDAIDSKVDKVTGKGLSTNDYTDEEKEKLINLPTKTELDSDLENKQDKLTFDDEPTGDSDNPVKSSGVFNALSDKVNTTDLSSYVKNTDYATQTKGGVVKVHPGYGFVIGELGTLMTNKADQTMIDRKINEFNPIVPANLDYAVKAALSGANRINDMTDEEKTNARSVIGAIGKTELAELKQKSIPHADAAGYPIMLSDHLSGEEFTKFNLYGNADGIGTLDSESGKYKIPIVQKGKNLFDISKVNSFVGVDYTTNRNTYSSISDGIVTSNIGTYAAGALWKDSKMKLPAGTYTLSADCMADKDTGNKSVQIMVFDFMLQKNLGKICALSAYKTWERLSAAFTLENEREIAILIQGVGVKDDYKNMQIKIKNVQLETGSSATGYEEYKEKTVTAILDNALSAGEYIDLVNMKLHSADTVTDIITVKGDLALLDSERVTYTCDTDVQPSKIEVTYYQDINKVIEELKNAILSQGGNV